MARAFPRHPFGRLTLLFACTWLGCSGTGAGCAALEPLGSTGFKGAKTDNAVNIRLSPAGLSYVNANWKTLIETFAPGQKLVVPLPCTTTNVAVFGDILIADQGKVDCTDTDCGRMDKSCDKDDVPKDINLTISSFALVPKAPDVLEAKLGLAIDFDKLYFDSANNICLTTNLKCSVSFHSSAKAPATNAFGAEVAFTIDTRWDKLLSFSVKELKGTQICGSSGAPAAPSCLEPDDLDIDGENPPCSAPCSASDVGFIKEFILKFISPMIQNQIKDAIATQSCQACGDGQPACPDIAGASSSCDATKKVCVDDSTKKCVPRFLGVEGRLSPGALLGSFGVPAGAKLDISAAAGSSRSVDTGFSVGMRGGVAAVGVADCVPKLAAPAITEVPAPNFDAAATPGSPYHVGIGLAQPFLNLAFHQGHQSGALCIALTSDNVGLINTGLFKTFLPSLGKLATRDGKDAPMMVVLRPAKAPQVTVGQGTYDPVTKRPVKPLLTVGLPDVTVDFYALLDDRYARLFSLTADIALPLSLVFNGCSSVQPVLGDLKQLITNIRPSSSEILAENPKVLTDLIPAVIGLAEPAIAQALSPFSLPELGNFKLKINEAKGVGPIAGTEHFHHLGLFAQLLPAETACAVTGPRVTATLREGRVPEAQAMRLTGKGLPVPTAVLAVQTLGALGTPEYAYRVDGGMWRPFEAPAAGGTLEVSHPAFLLQGKHRIEVRARIAEQPQGFSAPVAVEFLVDWDAPEVRLSADREAGRLVVRAYDAVSGEGALSYAYRVGDGAFSPFGPAREIDLAAIEGQGGVIVRARDEAGNVGEATWRVPVVGDHPGAETLVGGAAQPAAGCTAAGGGLSLLALAVALVHRARRRR